jgi:hypothetical protein
MRGTISVSPVIKARRSAFDTTTSSVVIENLCDTPLRLSTR